MKTPRTTFWIVNLIPLIPGGSLYYTMSSAVGSDFELFMPRLLAVKSGKIPPQRCGVCEYCRATKMLSEPVEFDLVGLSAPERMVLLGG